MELSKFGSNNKLFMLFVKLTSCRYGHSNQGKDMTLEALYQITYLTSYLCFLFCFRSSMNGFIFQHSNILSSVLTMTSVRFLCQAVRSKLKSRKYREDRYGKTRLKIRAHACPHMDGYKKDKRFLLTCHTCRK